MSQSRTLKICPFCGAVPFEKSYVDEYSGDMKYLVGCDNPKCRIQPCTSAHRIKAVITREWNRRVTI